MLRYGFINKKKDNNSFVLFQENRYCAADLEFILTIIEAVLNEFGLLILNVAY